MINILAVFDPVSFFIYMAISMAISYAIAMLTQKKTRIDRYSYSRGLCYISRRIRNSEKN
jgi:hypothetical protein